ncbi:toxin-antitoxin system, toxin component, GNAT family [delta proteobacterium NaphS2]|nr:toxin-antitoxin system, toxin component, GNAT family [delta proteobacterium NaphS2]
MGYLQLVRMAPAEDLNPDLVIRNGERRDLSSMVRLLKILFTADEDFAVNAERQRSGLKMMLEAGRKSHCIKVAEMDGKVVGMCTVQLLISTAEGGVVGLVEDMVVDPEFRGQCIGRLLMEHIEAWALKRGVTRLQLLAERTNFPALKFYDKIGWQSTKLICVRRKW